MREDLHGDVRPRHFAPRPAVVLKQAVFALERFDDFYEESKALLQRHWEEVAKDKDTMRLDPDEEYYRALCNAGKMLFVTVRYSGTLVGYVWWYLYNHPHYKTVKCAQGDIHYLAPEYRRGLNGYILLKRAIMVVKQTGIKYCYIREKVGHEHPAIMKRLGFNRLDVTYSCDMSKGLPR